MMKLPPRQEWNLNLLKSMSHSVGYVLQQFECIPYCQPCEDNHAQHELSYNPNKFAIRDPRGGNWGEWGQNTEKVKIMLKI